MEIELMIYFIAQTTDAQLFVMNQCGETIATTASVGGPVYLRENLIYLTNKNGGYYVYELNCPSGYYGADCSKRMSRGPQARDDPQLVQEKC